MIEIMHIVHMVGEYDHTISIFTNLLFGVSLMHGGIHFLHIRVRRHYIIKRRRLEVERMVKEGK